MKISKEARVGLFATIALAILYFSFNFLKGADLFSNQNEYYVVYDNVGGLTESKPVTINGLVVGRVQSIDILQDEGNKLRVKFGIGKDIKLTDQTIALLADDGLLGGKVIQLTINPGKVITDEANVKSATQTGLAALIQEKSFPVLQNADSLITNLNKISRQFDQTGLILKTMLMNANQTTLGIQGLVKNNVNNFDNITTNAALLGTNLNSFAKNLTETEKQIGPILQKTNIFADSLQAIHLGRTVADLNRSVKGIENLLAEINAGKGTMGKLVKDDSLYTNLDRTAASMNYLLSDLKTNPKRYVHFSLFGKK